MTDTSELFIKMVDCPEIQGQKFNTGHCKLFQVGDQYIWRNDPDHVVHISVTCTLSAMTCIWLPTQPQLQEIVRQPFENDYALTCRFKDFIPGHPESSMEVLWLAFVMQEKFGKWWIGDKWEAL